VAARNRQVLERLRVLKGEHPFWGYRRVWAHLRFIDGLSVNKKRVLRLLREHRLTVSPKAKLKALRVSNRPKPRPNRPNRWWGIDMTKVMTESGWVYLVLVLDWYTKKILGHHAGRRATGADWLLALRRALDRQFPDGRISPELCLMSDNGSQPTALGFMRGCARLGVHQAFTCYNNPKGNADTERMMRTLKEELIWLREWKGETDLAEAVKHWIETYNETYLHSALGYQPPNRFEKTYNLSPTTPYQAA
jgi:transposase InsO family protein